jgi:hypothetical protein
MKIMDVRSKASLVLLYSVVFACSSLANEASSKVVTREDLLSAIHNTIGPINSSASGYGKYKFNSPALSYDMPRTNCYVENVLNEFKDAYVAIRFAHTSYLESTGSVYLGRDGRILSDITESSGVFTYHSKTKYSPVHTEHNILTLNTLKRLVAISTFSRNEATMEVYRTHSFDCLLK